eukprot:5863767-Karenia_brevis.AAC.1
MLLYAQEEETGLRNTTCSGTSTINFASKHACGQSWKSQVFSAFGLSLVPGTKMAQTLGPTRQIPARDDQQTCGYPTGAL